MPVTAYPTSFATDLQAYLDHLAGNDLFAETARQPACPLTIHDNRLQLLQLAAALVRSGRDPTSVGRLADLVAVDAAEVALKFIWERNGRRKTGQLHRFALLLVKLAKHWVKVSPEHLEALRQLRKKVNPGCSGMTARNRARLRQFDDPVNVARLVNLPETIMRRVLAESGLTYNGAIRAQSALAIAIVLAAPLRVKNLAGLTLDRHFVRARPGPDATVHLVVPAHEVKNDSRPRVRAARHSAQAARSLCHAVSPAAGDRAIGLPVPGQTGRGKASGTACQADPTRGQAGDRAPAERPPLPPSRRQAVPRGAPR